VNSGLKRALKEEVIALFEAFAWKAIKKTFRIVRAKFDL
jgi:hypothetical protein